MMFKATFNNISVKWPAIITILYINAREYRSDNEKWTFQRTQQHRTHKTKKNKTKTKHNMYWTPLYVNKHI